MLTKVEFVCILEAAGLLNQESVRTRQYWIHPFHAERDRSEQFLIFYNNIRKYWNKFFEYYRMSTSSFDELLEELRPVITKQNTFFRNPISAEERLTITLRYLATGTNFAALQYEFYVAKCTIAQIVRETCQAIWYVLKEKEMPKPTEEMWLEIAETFYAKTDFPNCIGAVDGKHIRCRNPRKSGSQFFNYKQFFSVVLMAVADANLRFIAIDVGAYGKEGDSTVFRDSPLGRKLYSDKLNIPKPRCLPDTTAEPQPFVLVGDEGFRLHTNLLRPFPQRHLTPRRRVFNYRLSRCGRSVECAFGVLANKWRIFHTPILVQPDSMDDIIKACGMLHNFVRKRDGVNYQDTLTHPFNDIDDYGPSARAQGINIREFFADYFMGAGVVSFQRNHYF